MNAAMDRLSPETTAFLAALRANNDRAWFGAHKADYEAHLKHPGDQFAVAVADAMAARIGTPHDYRVFRIQRDVRFARDKPPPTPISTSASRPTAASARAGQPGCSGSIRTG